MLKAGEISLEKLIDSNTIANSYDYKQKITLILAILRAIKDFHQSSGLIHADIKPGNIVIDMVDPHHPIAKLVDVGMSIKKNTAAGPCGTPDYLDPSLIQSLNSNVIFKESCDIFSTARTLEHLFFGSRFADRFYDLLTGEAKLNNNIMKYLVSERNDYSKNSSYPFYDNGFQCCNVAGTDKAIKLHLAKMLHKNPESRGTIDDSIDFFENLYLQEKIKTTTSKSANTAEVREIENAHKIAKTLRDKLANPASLKIIPELILKELPKIKNYSQKSVEHFLDTLNIRYLYNCSDIEEIQARLNNLQSKTLGFIKTFLSKSQPDAQSTYTEFQAMLHSKVFEDARRRAFHKLNKCKTLDDHVEFLDKMNRLNEEINKEFKLIKNTSSSNCRITIGQILENEIKKAYKINSDFEAAMDPTNSKLSKQNFLAYTVCEKVKTLNNSDLTNMVKDELHACRSSRFFIMPKSRLEKQLETMSKKLHSNPVVTSANDITKQLRHALLTYTYERGRSWVYKLANKETKTNYENCMTYARQLADQILLSNNILELSNINQKIISFDANLKNIMTEYAVSVHTKAATAANFRGKVKS